MADLHVERKRRNVSWPIALLLLAVAGAGAAFYVSNRPARDRVDVSGTSLATVPVAASSPTPQPSSEPLLNEPLPSLPSITTTEVTTTSGIRGTREERDASMPAERSEEVSDRNSADASAAANDTSTATTGAAPITDLGVILEAADRTTLDGRAVRLTGLKLQRQVGGLLAIGSDPEHWLLVAPAIGRGPAIPAGATLSVNGMIQTLPGEAETAKRWKISGSSREHLAGKQIYIQASLIDVGR